MMRRIKNWLSRATQIFNNTVSVAKLLVGAVTNDSTSPAIYVKAGGSESNKSVFLWKADHATPYSNVYLDDDGSLVELHIHLEDYNEESGDVTIHADTEIGFEVSQVNDKLYVYNGAIKLISDEGVHIQHGGTKLLSSDINNNIKLPSLPTSNPTLAGALWNDSGTLKVSAG